MRKNLSERELVFKMIITALGVGTIAFAFKFTTFFENWYWLPVLPNIFDVVFLICAGLALLFLGFTRPYHL